MMRKIVFATNNPNKLNEIRLALSDKFEVVSLKDINCNEELPETHETLEENALEKAQYVLGNYNIPCFADDTGLEISALNGAPGVYSAMYAGSQRSSEDNMSKVLSEMSEEENREARFRTVIALVDYEGVQKFEGIVDGEITQTKSGSDGFGYDPIFKPNEANVTFAEMSMQEKNKISHRGRAVAKLVQFLTQ